MQEAARGAGSGLGMMFERLKQLVKTKPAPEFNDPVLGSLVSKHRGVWCGKIAFAERQVGLLIPGLSLIHI